MERGGRVHERREERLWGGFDPGSLTPTPHRTGPAVGGRCPRCWGSQAWRRVGAADHLDLNL